MTHGVDRLTVLCVYWYSTERCYIGLLRRDTLYSAKIQPTFKRKQLTPKSTLKSASITFSENLGNYQTKLTRQIHIE